MCQPVHDPISSHEILLRNLVRPFSVHKNRDEIKRMVLYPNKKEDKERPGYYTNKISMNRLCRSLENGVPSWNPVVRKVHTFLPKDTPYNVEFKGFLAAKSHNFMMPGIALLPAASKENPFHMHVVLTEYNEQFRAVDKFEDLIPLHFRIFLDRLTRDLYWIKFSGHELEDKNQADICALCSSHP